MYVKVVQHVRIQEFGKYTQFCIEKGFITSNQNNEKNIKMSKKVDKTTKIE